MNALACAAAECLLDEDAPALNYVSPDPADKGAPCVLEANRTGTWFKVLEFDAAAVPEVHYMRTGVARLCMLDAQLTFRVRTRAQPCRTLQNYSDFHGWTEA
jgi:hypothetical protein